MNKSVGLDLCGALRETMIDSDWQIFWPQKETLIPSIN